MGFKKLFNFFSNAHNTSALQREYDAARADGKLLASFTHGESVLIADRDTPSSITLLSREKRKQGYLYFEENVSAERLQRVMQALIDKNMDGLRLVESMFTPQQEGDAGTLQKSIMTVTDHAEILRIFTDRRNLEDTARLIEQETGIVLKDALTEGFKEALKKEYDFFNAKEDNWLSSRAFDSLAAQRQTEAYKVNEPIARGADAIPVNESKSIAQKTVLKQLTSSALRN